MELFLITTRSYCLSGIVNLFQLSNAPVGKKAWFYSTIETLGVGTVIGRLQD